MLALVGVIVYELITKSSLSWHAFGWKFFFRSEWDPVNEQFGAWPFVYGTLVSSLLALVLAVPLAVGVAVFITEMCPRWLKGCSGIHHRVAGGNSQCDLRIVGDLCAGAAAARVRGATSGAVLGMDRAV